MAKYTVKDLPENRHASVPVYVEDIAKFGEGNVIFQLYCAVGYGDDAAAVEIAKYIINCSYCVRGSSLDPNYGRAPGPYGGYLGRYGIDRAVAFLEYAIRLNEHNGEAHFYLGYCFEREKGWHYSGVGTWDRDYRNKKSAKAEYEKATSNGYAGAYLFLSHLYESMYREAAQKNDGDMNLAAYFALMAIANDVPGARTRYLSLKVKGYDGGNLLTVFRASHPDVKI